MSDDYTPGPWQAEVLTRGDGYIGDTEVWASGELIAVVTCDKSGTDEETDTRLNARLIAAAPELLTACRGFIVAIALQKWDALAARGAVSDAMDKASAAIMKATGAP